MFERTPQNFLSSPRAGKDMPTPRMRRGQVFLLNNVPYILVASGLLKGARHVVRRAISAGQVPRQNHYPFGAKYFKEIPERRATITGLGLADSRNRRFLNPSAVKCSIAVFIVVAEPQSAVLPLCHVALVASRFSSFCDSGFPCLS